MRISQVEITGFRGYSETVKISFTESLTVIIGRNDAGKSTILEALNLFFGGGKPSADDFTVGRSGDLAIACTFDELPEKLVLDSSFETSLSNEYLTQADGSLCLLKRWKGPGSGATVHARCIHPTQMGSESLLSMKLPTLKSMWIKIDRPPIADERVCAHFRAALWKRYLSDGTAALEESEVNLMGEEGKKIYAALERSFPAFHLFQSDTPATPDDKLAQDPVRLAVNAVLARHEDELERLSSEIIAELSEALQAVTASLNDLAPGLAEKLTPSIPNPTWHKALSGSSFVDERNIPLSRRGSGVRRLVLMSFFRSQVEANATLDTTPASIMAIEEPETALHPRLQREIIDSLAQVAALEGRQVIITTHSSNLVSNTSPGQVRLVQRSDGISRVLHPDEGQLGTFLQNVNEELGIFSDHNVKCFLLVEGKHDITALELLTENLASRETPGVSPFKELVRDGRLRILSIGGCTAQSLWHETLTPLNRPQFSILDSDRKSASHSASGDAQKLQRTAGDGRHVTILQLREMENYLPREAILAQYTDIVGFEAAFDRVTDGIDLGYADIPRLCAQAVHECSDDPNKKDWDELIRDKSDPKALARKEGNAKARLAQAFSHPSVLTAGDGKPTDLIDCLRKIAETATAAP